MDKSVEKKRFYNIDFLRFVFCISIILFHFSISTIKLEKNCPDISWINSSFQNGVVCVDFFFIIAGFFWCMNADKCKCIIDFTIKKIIRMWPVICFGVIICAVLGLFKIIHFDIYANIENLLFLNSFGLTAGQTFHRGYGNLHPTWFVSTLFWILIFYQYIYMNFSKKIVNILMAIVIFFFLPLGIITHAGAISGPMIKGAFLFMSMGAIRALYGCAIGYFVAELYKKLYPVIEKFELNLKWNYILSIINISALSVIFYNLFIEAVLKKHVIFLIICFVFIFITFIFNKDFVSRFFNKRNFGVLGAYSFAIYVMHAIPLEIFSKHILTKKNIENVEVFTVEILTCYVIAIIVLGVFTHYYVEKKMTKKLTDMYLDCSKKIEVINEK